jgi:hypothetical protein
MQANQFINFLSLFNKHYKNNDLYLDTKCFSNKIPVFILFLYKHQLITGGFSYFEKKKINKNKYNNVTLYTRLRVYYKFSTVNKKIFNSIIYFKHHKGIKNTHLKNYFILFQTYFFPFLIIQTSKGFLDGYTAARQNISGRLYAIIKK